MDLVEFVCDNKEALLVVISAIISFVSAWYIQKVTHSYELDSFRIELVMHACQDLYASLWDLIILTGKYVSFYSSNESIDRKRELLNEYNMVKKVRKFLDKIYKTEFMLTSKEEEKSTNTN